LSDEDRPKMLLEALALYGALEGEGVRDNPSIG
jgi:hypothetical protein